LPRDLRRAILFSPYNLRGTILIIQIQFLNEINLELSQNISEISKKGEIVFPEKIREIFWFNSHQEIRLKVQNDKTIMKMIFSIELILFITSLLK
jgi:hypothetical protein